MPTLSDIKKREQIVELVCAELDQALYKFGDFRSPHEAYAILLEEFDKLWGDIKNNDGKSSWANKEAIQIAAMAINYVVSYGNVEILKGL